MSLGIMIKGSEGVVLAADSRVTLFNQIPHPLVQGQTLLVPATFDNATKVLQVKGQTHVGAVTYGLGALMTADGPRTMQSFIPELEEQLEKAKTTRLSVSDFAKTLSDFFVGQWNKHVNRPSQPGEEIVFMVSGYDEGAAYGRGFMFQVPQQPNPVEQNAGAGQFGMTWGGQSDLVNRLLFGFDLELLPFIKTKLNLSDQQLADFRKEVEPKFAAGIPYQFLPLQDCVDLAVFLIASTIQFQRFRSTAVRGVGGMVEVATLTKTDGLKFRSQRAISVAANTIGA
jgi:hypothetical protein